MIRHLPSGVVTAKERFSSTAEEALNGTRDLMRRIKLELNEEKTRIVDARIKSFDFLGSTFGPMHSPKNGVRYLGAAPSKARVRRLRQAGHRYLSPHNQSPVDEVIAHLNRLLVGWQNDCVSRGHAQWEEVMQGDISA